MSTFAIVENDVVSNTVICESLEVLTLLLPDKTLIEETEATGIAWVGSEIIGGKFKPPQPYESWSFDGQAFEWEAPTEMPDDGQAYYWNEEQLNWVVIELPEIEEENA